MHEGLSSGTVVFRIGAQAFCLATEIVVEVTRMVALAAPPGDGTGVIRGVATYRGEVAPVLDIHRLVHQPALTDIAFAALVFARPPRQHLGRIVGLIVDEILEVRTAHPPEAEERVSEELARVQSVISHGGRLVFRLDLDRLVSRTPEP